MRHDKHSTNFFRHLSIRVASLHSHCAPVLVPDDNTALNCTLFMFYLHIYGNWNAMLCIRNKCKLVQNHEHKKGLFNGMQLNRATFQSNAIFVEDLYGDLIRRLAEARKEVHWWNARVQNCAARGDNRSGSEAEIQCLVCLKNYEAK